MRRETPRTLGVEEEFHLVDLKTTRLTARAPELLAELSDDWVVELQRCVVEMNSRVVDTLEGLRAELVDRRRVLVDTAARLGISVVAAGAVPLSIPAEMQVTQTARYRQMLADYQLLAREQLICGTQVHAVLVGAAVAVALGAAVGWAYALAGWVAAVAVYVGWTWIVVSEMDSESTAAHATREDPTRVVTDLVVVLSSVAGVGGVG